MRTIQLILTLISLSIPCLCFGGDFSIGLGTTHFEYEEFRKKESLNYEQGMLPHLKLSSNISILQKEFRLEAYSAKGKANYEGKTQFGAPLITQTEEDIYRLSALIKPFGYDLYIGLNTELWKRNILATSSTLGLEEYYRWYSWLGMYKLNLWSNHNYNADLKLSLSKSFEENISIDLSETGFGRPKIEIGNTYNIQAELFLNSASQHQLPLSLSFFARYRKIEEGPKIRILGETLPATIYEPKSSSYIFGITLSWLFSDER